MRGIPPVQALFIVILLAILGFAGNRYIAMGEHEAEDNKPQQAALKNPTCSPTVEAEIELVFSSTPSSYRLSQPSETGEGENVLLYSSEPIENPSYDMAEVVSHGLATYWLDVTWAEQPGHGKHHFVQIHISPTLGEDKQFHFYSGNKEMNETFDYSTGHHHHE